MSSHRDEIVDAVFDVLYKTRAGFRLPEAESVADAVLPFLEAARAEGRQEAFAEYDDEADARWQKGYERGYSTGIKQGKEQGVAEGYAAALRDTQARIEAITFVYQTTSNLSEVERVLSEYRAGVLAVLAAPVPGQQEQTDE